MKLRTTLILVLALLAWVSPALAQENSDCMRCHEDDELYVEKGDEELPGWLDIDVYENSAHGRLECIACHQDLIDEDLPHDDDLEPVDCAECHEKLSEKHAGSAHGQALAKGDPMAPKCSDCHGKHDVLGHTDPKSRTYSMNIPLLCGTCHHEGTPVSITHDIPQDRIFENYSQSIHGEGVFKKGLVVTAVCTSCHTSHDILPHTDPRSSVSPQRVVDTCLTCHANIEQVHRKVIEGHLWEEEPHKIPNCVDCHAPHKVRRPFYPEGMANQDCLRCHEQRDLSMVRRGLTVSLFVSETHYADSAHAGVGCAQCHVEAQKSHVRSCETIKNPVDCSICHADAVTQHEEGAHGKALAKGDAGAPTCVDCHETHRNLPKSNRDSRIAPRNVAALCADCHGDDTSAAAKKTPTGAVRSYETSVHGTGMARSGLVVTASCVSCHGPHKVLPASDEESSVNHRNVAETCGKCHQGIEDDLKYSVHWPGNAETDRELPACSDCHSAHSISRTDDQGYRHGIMDQCGRCHEEQTHTYFESFHGKVSQLGFDKAADCADCHGSHSILGKQHSASWIAPGGRTVTCRKCHEDANDSFADYLVHVNPSDKAAPPGIFWSYWGMMSLLLGTMAFFAVHSILWMVRLWRDRAQWAPAKAARSKPGARYLRFDRVQRALHFSMVLCFLTLAFTGMSLKFSSMPWAQWVGDALGGFEVTGFLHRFAAFGLLCVGLTHLRDVNGKRLRDGQTWFGLLRSESSILFQPRDLGEFIGTMKWFVGLGPRPSYGRWTYWEKFDYFAVLWGLVIIGGSGLILWYPEAATVVLPGVSINIASIIHGDEALLAVSFIFTIHFFNTQFRPDKFPLDTVIFTGRAPMEEIEHERPRELEHMREMGLLEERMREPLDPRAEHAAKAFAIMALSFGIMLALLILLTLVTTGL